MPDSTLLVWVCLAPIGRFPEPTQRAVPSRRSGVARSVAALLPVSFANSEVTVSDNDDNFSSTLMDAFGARDGDPMSWARLEERLRPWMQQRLASERLPSGLTADDIISATFLDVYRGLVRFESRPGSTFRDWVCTIMLNRLRDVHRREQRRTPGSGIASLDAADSSLGGMQVADDREWRASMLARHQEIRSDFLEALSTLDEEKRTVVALHVLESMPFESIAKRVGRNKTVTVRAIYHRAMEKVRELMRRHEE
ncbi:MAG: RNA polymerase sigma factor [Planctomycetota bacterium]